MQRNRSSISLTFEKDVVSVINLENRKTKEKRSIKFKGLAFNGKKIIISKNKDIEIIKSRKWRIKDITLDGRSIDE